MPDGHGHHHVCAASDLIQKVLVVRAKQITRVIYGVLFILAGANHFLNTSFYLSIMPPYLSWHVALVYISGIAEIGLGGLLLSERWSWVAAWGLIALLIAIFPANIRMALHPDLYQWASPRGLWLRLPLQGALIGWAYWYTRLPRSWDSEDSRR
jgi:uncharacterized membrane protein